MQVLIEIYAASDNSQLDVRRCAQTVLITLNTRTQRERRFTRLHSPAADALLAGLVLSVWAPATRQLHHGNAARTAQRQKRSLGGGGDFVDAKHLRCGRYEGLQGAHTRTTSG